MKRKFVDVQASESNMKNDPSTLMEQRPKRQRRGRRKLIESPPETDDDDDVHPNDNDNNSGSDTEYDIHDDIDIDAGLEEEDVEYSNSANRALLTKQTSVVDLTHGSSSQENKGANTSHITHMKQTKLTLVKRTRTLSKNKSTLISSIAGPRSRSDFYAKQQQQKQGQKQKRTQKQKQKQSRKLKTSSRPPKRNDVEDISEDSDCVILANANGQMDDGGDGGGDAHPTFEHIHTQQWIDKYAPQNIDDLYLHKKKLEDMDGWFRDAFAALDGLRTLNGRNVRRLQYVKSVLFVVGQSGVGKTATIQCLCQKYDAKLVCYPSIEANTRVFNQSVWHNDNTHFMNFHQQNRARTDRDMEIGVGSQLDNFESFLSRCKKFGALKVTSAHAGHGGHVGGGSGGGGAAAKQRRQVLLVSELPYVGKPEYLYRFREIVDRVCDSTRTVVVFEITSECEGTRDDLQVFGSKIRTHSRVTTIRFNPVNKTLMKKCLTRILSVEKLSACITNAKALVDHIVEHGRGDLRNAIQTMQMKCVETIVQQSTAMTTQLNSKTNTKTASRSKWNKSSPTMQTATKMSDMKSTNIACKEETLSIFHSLGKILYAKKENEPELILEKGDLDCVTFVDLLYENFPDFFIYNQRFMPDTQHEETRGNGHGQPTVDEFGFELDFLEPSQQSSAQQIAFEKYCATLQYFGDADLCCTRYNRLKFEDTATDLRSAVNDEQFGCQLYPAIYAASIACRGYLIAHEEPPAIKRPPQRYKNKGASSLLAFRGSTYKKVKGLFQELYHGLNDVLIAKTMKTLSRNTEHFVRENEICLIRSLLCQPMSLFVEIFPLISNVSSGDLRSYCNDKALCVSMIRTSNLYSQKYETKTFTVPTRFEYIQQSLSYSDRAGNAQDEDSDSDDRQLIDEIEAFDE